MTEYQRRNESMAEDEYIFRELDRISEPTETSKNKLVFSNHEKGVYLYQANCLELMDAIYDKYPDGCFDAIFADPPYFLSNGGITCQNGKMVSVNKGKWDKSRGPDLNHEFNMEWLMRAQRTLKPNGTIWVSGTMHAIYSIGFAMQKLGFKLLNDIIWEKPNPPPNLSCRYFTHATETIIWASKNKKSRHTFNYDLMKSHNCGKQMRSVWKIFPPAQQEKLFGKHPTQKPELLVSRCILASTNAGDFIYDPFSGGGTTGCAAIKNNRKFCGSEIEDEFISLSKSRFTQAIEEISGHDS